MIRTTGLTKSYGDLNVLKGVDFEAAEGEVVSIVGSSGAGKSTFLQIAGTLDKPDAGELFFEGLGNPFQLSASRLARFRNQNMGFIFQYHHLLPEFSALENVCMPGFIAKKDVSATKKKAMDLLDYLGIADRSEHRPSELSGGEQQRVAVARALLNEPRIIFADEPSGNLDSQNAKELHQLFFKLRDDFGQTFIIVTHNEQLAGMSDRTVLMKDGKIIKQ